MMTKETHKPWTNKNAKFKGVQTRVSLNFQKLLADSLNINNY